jgi:hypothetical protein
VKTFATKDFIGDRPSLLATGMPLLLSLGELKGLIDISKPTRVYTLGDTAIDAVAGVTLSAPDNLRLTVRGNQFESRLLGTTIKSGVDTLVWELNSSSAFVTITGNTMWSFSNLPTVAVLNGEGFDVTGNVLGNAFTPTANQSSLALIVNPGPTRGTPDAPINMFTISGNTIFGTTNLADFVRQEWRVRLPPELAPLSTWEFFNTIG